MRRATRRWRWLVVAAAVASLVAAPIVVSRWPVAGPGLEVPELLARARTSAQQPYQVYVATRGGLRLPDIGPLDEVAGLFGQTTHLRAWVRDPSSWRVDRLTTTGEVGTYREGDVTLTWDSGDRRTERAPEGGTAGTAGGSGVLRLPRPADLLPAELGRRLLAAAAADEVRPIAARRVAGRAAAGLRITPRSPVTTIDHADVWIDPDSGLPLAADVTARGDKAPSLTSEALGLSLDAPSVERVTFTPPTGPGYRIREGDRVLDAVQLLQRASPVPLPETLGGLRRDTDHQGGVATYDAGFSLVTVVGVPAGLLPAGLRGLAATDRPWGGRAIVVETALVKAELLDVGATSYLVAGTVSVAELDRLAGELAGAGAGPAAG